MHPDNGDDSRTLSAHLFVQEIHMHGEERRTDRWVCHRIRKAAGTVAAIVMTAPENALRPDDGLLGLVNRARTGDEILWTQLYEHLYWGDADGNVVSDPNPRLAALVAAARRGARVRVLLDELFDDADDARGNRATAEYLNALAAAAGLDLAARLGNPTGGGIHAKLVLVRVGGATWSAVGSLNGGEVSHKLNREVVLMVDAPAVYARLAEIFAWDWAHAPAR